MSDTTITTPPPIQKPPVAQPAAKTPPILPQAPMKYVPPVTGPIEIQKPQVKITKSTHKGIIADVKAELAATEHTGTIKATLQSEIDGSGAKAVTVDIHRHEMQGKTGKTVVIHGTIKPLF
jgi:hypothetical protein